MAVVPGRVKCASVVGIACCESGAPKGAERFQTGHEALGWGRLPQPGSGLALVPLDLVSV